MTLTSTIINLGDYRMDDEDRRLRELFAHTTVPDDGFSGRVIKRIRRKHRLRRLLLPLALLTGGVFAARPVLAILDEWSVRLHGLSADLGTVGDMITALTGTMVLVVPLLVGGALIFSLLEE